MQFKAGYIVDSIAKIITDLAPKEKLDEINGLLQYVSSFDVEFFHTHSADFKILNPVLATLNNIITRGLPTKAPVIIEETFVSINLVEPNKEGELDFPSVQDTITFETVFELLHIIEPNLKVDRSNYGGELGSQLEWKFIKDNPIFYQILESQRDFETISKKMKGGRSVDFSFTSPYLYRDENKRYSKNLSRIFEIDGPHHLLSEYKYYDLKRDDLASEENFDTWRFTAKELSNESMDYSTLLGNVIYAIFQKNYDRVISEHLSAYSLIFIPLAIARIQKTLVEYFLVHPEIFNQDKIEIAIIERDLPCGALAIEDLKSLFTNLNAILKDEDKLELPPISLTIFDSPQWVLKSELHLSATCQNEDFFNNNDFDIIIDHAILRRSKIYNEPDFKRKGDKTIKIRSSHYYDTSFGNTRRVYCAKLLNYESLVERKDDGSYIPLSKFEHHINFFIQNIFRKKGFREGQLPIISRALQQKPVIGLLPTGGGKSLTFQLPAFLQPGLCLVVDPIKSLMEDQVRVLKENWIDCCDFINSNLKRAEKVQKLIDFRYGETMFLFVSPERFVMQDFRNIIQQIDTSRFGLAFSYCVIDEVHCVSEWGHDFRSTYLMLGKNVQRFAKTKNGKAVSLIGLTATASFDVLADIERELQIEHSDVANAIIMIENTIRPELFFRVIDVTNQDRIEVLNSDFKKLGGNLAKYNQDEILQQSLAHHYIEFETLDYGKVNDDKTSTYCLNQEGINAITPKVKDLRLNDDLENLTQNDFYAIVFCPTKGDQKNKDGEFTDTRGVPFVYSKLDSKSKGFYYASDAEHLTKEAHEHFINFTTDKTKHIVCTKAFGMGIDKKDIRSTYHYFYSGSLESLVQEAGRSGRDKKIAEATILVSKKEAYFLDFHVLLFENGDDKVINRITNTFHRHLLRPIIAKSFSSKDDLVKKIEETIGKFKKWIDGVAVDLSIADKEQLTQRLFRFIQDDCDDRSIHDFFYKGSFKGRDIEISQVYALFRLKEFIVRSALTDINEQYNDQYAGEYVFKYWTKDANKRLYIWLDENDLGYIDLTLPLKEPKDPRLREILAFLVEFNEGNKDVCKLFVNNIVDDTLNSGTLIEMFNEAENESTFQFYITAQKKYADNFRAIFLKLSQKKEQKDIQGKQVATIDALLIKAKSFEDLVINPKGDYKSYFFKWFTLNSKFDTPYIERLQKVFNEKVSANIILETIYLIQIEKSFSQSDGNFFNFLLLLEELIGELRFTFNQEDTTEKWMRLYYNRDRNSSNDTGRLIYRMHSMGFLEDYLIDYNKESLYKCTFRKYDSITKYTEKIEEYLRRYLSEVSATERMNELNGKLTKPTLIENILECLNFLADFSYSEIASKRKRATTEIEDILNISITDEKYTADWYKQNIYIKEYIYFYFNAKYARRNFKIEGKDYSLLDDYESLLDRKALLEKYLNDVFKLEGAEQNNYKHMMGSCKKILRSLSETDLKKEWVLRLLKAFAMYSVNNTSYISEANEELERGFLNLYEDEDFYQDDFSIIEPIFVRYFELLLQNIQPQNEAFMNIKLIRVNLLLQMQITGIENMLITNQQLIAENYA